MKSIYLNLLLLVLVFPALVSCVPLFAVGVGAGVGASAAISEDRRTSGMFVEDEIIELKSVRRIKQQFAKNVHINVTSFNRNVLLSGEAPDEATKGQIEKLVMSVQNVRNLFNEISISEKSTLASRSNDTLTTSKVKGRFLRSGKFQINHIKIVTEKNVVFLLGMVKHIEADSAAEIASTTAGVTRVVKVFEYLD